MARPPTAGAARARRNFPQGGWEIKDGMLTVNETRWCGSRRRRRHHHPREILRFRAAAGFQDHSRREQRHQDFVAEPRPDHRQRRKAAGSSIGPEFQILDDARHPDAKLGRDGNRTIGSLYDMITAAADKKVNPDRRVEPRAHIVQGQPRRATGSMATKTVEFERGSRAWRDLVANSKYKVWPAFGELPEGHILLQDHGNQVFYRNIKIRVPEKK